MGKTNELDKFYTAPHLASKCVDEFNEHVNICDGDVVIEPSAGDGSFARFFWTKESLQFDAYDLAPEHSDIKKQDFLEFDLSAKYGTRGLHFVGNPPFGHQASLAIKFINQMTSQKNTKSISLVLPASCGRNSFKDKHIPYNYHLVHENYCDEFIENGEKKSIRCVYQIWVKMESERPRPFCRKVSKLFSFVKGENEADFIIGNKKQTGKVLPKNAFVAKASNGIYIKFDMPIHKEMFAELAEAKHQLIKVNKHEFVACPNTTKPEVVWAIEQYIASQQTDEVETCLWTGLDVKLLMYSIFMSK